MNFRAANPQAAAVWHACNAELEAVKPGNVGRHGDGHGMRVADFLTSAAVCANPLAEPALSVGERIWRSVRATRAAVGCNTNLGIVLLAAPLCRAAQHGRGPFAQRLRATLEALDVDDAEHAFAAIRLAAPAGLGRSGENDVAAPAQVSLLQAMRTAADRDRIALQYAAGYRDLFALGLPALAEPCSWPPAWRTTGVYLRFLAAFADTHVVRKHGPVTAEALRRYGAQLRRRLAADGPCRRTVARLLDADRLLKRRGINPGTSADLTVASLLLERLLAAE